MQKQQNLHLLRSPPTQGRDCSKTIIGTAPWRWSDTNYISTMGTDCGPARDTAGGIAKEENGAHCSTWLDQLEIDLLSGLHEHE